MQGEKTGATRPCKLLVIQGSAIIMTGIRSCSDRVAWEGLELPQFQLLFILPRFHIKLDRANALILYRLSTSIECGQACGYGEALLGAKTET